MSLQVKIELPPKLLPELLRPHRYKVLKGGRGSGKSTAITDAFLALSLEKKRRFLCTRQYQVSIRESVHQILRSQIERLGLSDYFVIQNDVIRSAQGSEFIFRGLQNNPDEIKSMEGIDYCWVEEGQSVSHASWEVLLPTIRKPGSEIWISMNPKDEHDPTYQRFVVRPPPDTWVCDLNWMDNPWFPEVLAREKDHAYATDPEGAEHVWGGKLRKRSKAEVLHGKWVVRDFAPQPGWHGPYYGVDWGFSSSATAIVRVWVSGAPGDLDHVLWIEHEAYGLGVDNDELPALFSRIPEADKYVIRADAARPETISHMRRHGYKRCTAAPKWPGSVEDGIAHLRGYKQIVIHPRCRHTIEEAGLWRHKVDRLTGDILPDLVKEHDHCWDAIRYGLSPVIRGSLRKRGVPKIQGTYHPRNAP